MYNRVTHEDMKALRMKTKPRITQEMMASRLSCEVRKIQRYEAGETELTQEEFELWWNYCHSRIDKQDDFFTELTIKLKRALKLL